MPDTRTLKEFAKDQRRATCAVCKLPIDAREQLRGAGDAKITRETQLTWLAAEFNATVSMEELDRHRSERHDFA
jgi:hypothetical protein